MFKSLISCLKTLFKRENALFFFRRQIKTHRRRALREFYNEMAHLHYTEVGRQEKKTLRGLHELLSHDKKIRFSILIKGKDKKAEASALNQTAPFLEVIDEGEAPTGTHILVLEEGDRMRVDLLYRYEQILRTKRDENLVLYTSAVRLDSLDRLTPGMLHAELRPLHFPYEFMPMALPGLLIPKRFFQPHLTPWDLDALGARFLGIPLPLLGKRSVDPIEPNLASYIEKKGLSWDLQGERAVPKLDYLPHVQVIVPFKDHRSLTLAAVRSIQRSLGVKTFITAIDNQSQDPTLAEELRALGCEVIPIDEPFNYSRLNNLAVQKTSHPQELLFFMNNDAEIAPDALLEMCRWIKEPKIGLVGCRLHYPDGSLQHGGVRLDIRDALPGALNWIHNESATSNYPHIADAVTAAASLTKREHFLSVGGFDEILYPIAYSDTHLAHKLSQKGLLTLYTPYATGIHHESTTRKPGLLEDFDRSQFLQDFSNS